MTATTIGTVAPKLGHIGASFYFRPETVATGKARGLDGYRFYFLGRGGVLGDVESEVALSAFGYFEPGLFAKMWNSAQRVMPPREAARLYIGCCHDFGRSRLDDVEGLDAFCEAAEAVIDAIEPTGLALYAGVAAEPRPDDAPARAMHLAMVLREARGSTHLVALVASGLSSRKAHQIRRPDDVALFGWPDPVEITEQDRVRWDRAEELTNELLMPSFAVLDESGERALVDGTLAIDTALGS